MTEKALETESDCREITQSTSSKLPVVRLPNPQTSKFKVSPTKPDIVNKQDSEKEKKKTLLKLVLILLLVCAAILGIFLAIKYTRKEKFEEEFLPTKKEVVILPTDTLVLNISYKPGQIFRLKSEKRTQSIFDQTETTGENFTQSIVECYEYIFTIASEEYSIENSINRTWYTSYFNIINHTLDNGTGPMLVGYDLKVNDYTNINKTVDYNSTEFEYVADETTNEFIKFEFYQSGEIKNIYLPDGVNVSSISTFKDILNIILPKLKSELYVDNMDALLQNLTSEKSKNSGNLATDIDNMEEFYDNDENITSNETNDTNDTYEYQDDEDNSTLRFLEENLVNINKVQVSQNKSPSFEHKIISSKKINLRNMEENAEDLADVSDNFTNNTDIDANSTSDESENITYVYLENQKISQIIPEYKDSGIDLREITPSSGNNSNDTESNYTNGYTYNKLTQLENN